MLCAESFLLVFGSVALYLKLKIKLRGKKKKKEEEKEAQHIGDLSFTVLLFVFSCLKHEDSLQIRAMGCKLKGWLEAELGHLFKFFCFQYLFFCFLVLKMYKSGFLA